MRISDWSSDVCSSDLMGIGQGGDHAVVVLVGRAARIGDVAQPVEVKRPGDTHPRSEERRVGKEVSVRVDLGGRRIIKKKTTHNTLTHTISEILSHTSLATIHRIPPTPPTLQHT